MIDNKIIDTDFDDGKWFLCAACHSDTFPDFIVGELYRFEFEGGNYCEVFDQQNKRAIRWVWNLATAKECHWDNGGAWVEFLPTRALTDEDLFAIKLGGIDAMLDILGPRKTEPWSFGEETSYS